VRSQYSRTRFVSGQISLLVTLAHRASRHRFSVCGASCRDGRCYAWLLACHTTVNLVLMEDRVRCCSVGRGTVNASEVAMDMFVW
jgi:hypothetical protein